MKIRRDFLLIPLFSNKLAPFMLNRLCESLLMLLFVSPFVVLFIDHDKSDGGKRWKLILFFVILYILTDIIVYIPIHYPIFRLFESSKNWSGKLYSLAFVGIFYLGARKTISSADFFRFKQEESSFRLILPLLLITVAKSMIINFFSGTSEFSWSTLIFNGTLPGIEEEMIYRGLLMSFLILLLKERITTGNLNWGSPAVFVTSVLFGLAHGFSIQEDWTFSMRWSVFFSSGFSGYLWGYAALKSRSILFPVMAHNSANLAGYLIRILHY